MRLFVASPVKLDDYPSIRRSFEEVLNAKWVEEENLHLTWVFLGERLSALPFLASLRRVSALGQVQPLHSLGSFGRPPRILFAQAEGKMLRQKSAQLQAAGLPLLRFNPHITLCRIKKIYDLQKFNALKKKYEGDIHGRVEREISLLESVLTPKGPIYLKLERITS